MILEIYMDRHNNDTLHISQVITNYSPLNISITNIDFNQSDFTTIIFSPSTSHVYVSIDAVSFLYIVKLLVAKNDYDIVIFKNQQSSNTYFKKKLQETKGTITSSSNSNSFMAGNGRKYELLVLPIHVATAT